MEKPIFDLNAIQGLFWLCVDEMELLNNLTENLSY
jgi:hypothetical protein